MRGRIKLTLAVVLMFAVSCGGGNSATAPVNAGPKSDTSAG